MIEQNAGSQKGTVILQHLHTRQQVPGQTVFFYPSMLQLHIIGNAHQPSYRRRMAVLQHWLDYLFQGIRLQHRVCIHADEVWKICRVDSHVQRISLATVFLANDGNRNFLCPCFINKFFRLAWHLPPNGPVHCMHIKGLDQRLGGVILGAIIHYYDLIGLVFQVQQRMDRSHHRYRLIPCRYNNRNGHMIVIG